MIARLNNIDIVYWEQMCLVSTTEGISELYGMNVILILILRANKWPKIEFILLRSTFEFQKLNES